MANIKRVNEIIEAPPAPDCSGTTIDGDVNIDISDEDINQIVEALCECIENAIEGQTTTLTETIQATTWLEISCPPCILVNGVKAQFVTILQNPVTLERIYLDGLGSPIDPDSIEIVTDPCDDRCGCQPCTDPDVYTSDECCECSSPEAKAEIAAAIAKEFV